MVKLAQNNQLTAVEMLREMIDKVERGLWRVDTFTMDQSQSEWGSRNMEVRIQVVACDTPILESPAPLTPLTGYDAQAFEQGRDLRLAQGSVWPAPEFAYADEYARGEWAVDPSTGETYKLTPDMAAKRRDVPMNRLTAKEVRALNETVKADRKAAREREANKPPPKPATPAGASPARDLDL